MIKKLSILSFLLLFSFFSVNATLTTDLKSYYSFDNGMIDSANFLNATNFGTINTTGKLGSSRLFNNPSNIDITGVTSTNNTFSISFWAKSTGLFPGGYGYFFDSLLGRLVGYQNSLGTNKIGIHGGLNGDSSLTLPLNSWQYLVYVVNGTSFKIYNNNALIYSGTQSLKNLGGSFKIGSNYVGTNAYYLGFIDEFGIWDRPLTQNEVTKLYNNGAGLSYSSFVNPINLIVNTPIDNFNYTYDVPSVLFNVSTSISTSCSYTYNNVTTLFSNTGGFNHSSIFNLPAGINQTQTFNVEFGCTNTTYSQYQNITFYKQQVPLALDIIVPKENQIFNIDTSQIEFYLQTNYVTDCNYKRYNNTIYTPFTSSHSWEHKTNFTTDLNVSTYNMNFFCTGVYVNENVSRNITFFLDELNKYGSGLTMTTSQLPQVGNDIGGFMKNSTPGITDFIFNLGIVSILVTLLVVVVSFVKKGLK